LGIYEILVVLGVAASPIAELRAAIPLAIIQYDFPWHYALLLAVVGNLLPVPFILLFLDAIARYLSRVKFAKRFLEWLFERTRRRSKVIERYERIGLALFVAIPLPFTGAWTGALAAVLLGLRFRQAMLSIVIGVIVAGIVVTCATVLGWTVFGLG
jgi:uncharacterized membrane protein